jgi:hypothetical protein
MKVMIESPLIQELLADQQHENILLILGDRFHTLPQDVKSSLQSIQDVAKLRELMVWAYRCADLDAFRSRLSS